MIRFPKHVFSGVLHSCLAVFLAYPHLPAIAKDMKMKPEELVAKHLESIGTAEARSAARSRVAGGIGQVAFRLPSSSIKQGNAGMISEGKKVCISMVFKSVEYPAEQFCFDGATVTVSHIQPGVRIYVPEFVYQYDVLMKEGLLGGSMSTAWCLLDVAGRQPKLEYNGLKKVDGKPMHELRYRAKKGIGELLVLLHFDPETFRHVHSEYRLVQPAGMANSPVESSGQQDTHYDVEESFGDFKTVDGLTLPHSWKLTYSREGMGKSILIEDSLEASRMQHNQILDPKLFIVP
jgi:hypothetical protein